MSLLLSSDAISLRDLTEVADKQVMRGLESVDGVGQVTMGGGRAREIHIVVDVEKLNSYGLTIDQVRDAVQRENVEIPGGTVEQGKAELALRTMGRIDSTDQFKDIIITTIKGTPIRISDVGYTEDSYERQTDGLRWQRQAGRVVDPAGCSGENTVKVTEVVKRGCVRSAGARPAASR